MKPARSYSPGRVQPRHLGGLATDKRAAVFAAGPRQAGDDLPGHLGIEFPGGVVIEEEQRHRAQHADVVDAVIDQILTYGLVPSGGEGDLEFRSHAVGRTDQNGLLPAGQPEAGAERADVGDHAGGEGGAGQTLDMIHGAIGLVNIDTGVFVTNRFVKCHRRNLQYIAPAQVTDGRAVGQAVPPAAGRARLLRCGRGRDPVDGLPAPRGRPGACVRAPRFLCRRFERHASVNLRSEDPIRRTTR